MGVTKGMIGPEVELGHCCERESKHTIDPGEQKGDQVRFTHNQGLQRERHESGQGEGARGYLQVQAGVCKVDACRTFVTHKCHSWL